MNNLIRGILPRVLWKHLNFNRIEKEAKASFFFAVVYHYHRVIISNSRIMINLIV